VGEGSLEPAAFAALIEGAPGSAGPVAPPRGLMLEAVTYPPGVLEWESD
jgi:hypothetical protein